MHITKKLLLIALSILFHSAIICMEEDSLSDSSLVIQNKFLADSFNEIIKQNFQSGIAESQILARKALKQTDLSLANDYFRSAIASLYKGMGHLTILSEIKNYALYKDMPLASMIFAKMDTTKYGYPHLIGTQINTLLAYLYYVQKNQLAPPDLYIELYYKMDENLANAIVDLIQHNRSITELNLRFAGWDPIILNKILRSVDKSKFIEIVTICDLSCSLEEDNYRRSLALNGKNLEHQNILKQEREKFLSWFNNNTKGSLSRIQEISVCTIFYHVGPAVRCVLNTCDNSQSDSI
jgi:hypothetical protein